VRENHVNEHKPLLHCKKSYSCTKDIFICLFEYCKTWDTRSSIPTDLGCASLHPGRLAAHIVEERDQHNENVSVSCG